MATAGARILVVEDDEAVRASLRAALEVEDHQVRELPDGAELEAVAAQVRPDVAILDVRLNHGPDGFALARTLRSSSNLPILFLTAADSVDDRLAGFGAGGDDYMAKPFSMAELLVRVAALLRRSGRLPAAIRQIDDIVIDEGAHTVGRNGTPIELTRTEYDLLVVLARQPGRVFSKTLLLSQVWGFDAYDPNLVEVHVSALRRKLEEHGSRVIQTVRGVGYVLRP